MAGSVNKVILVGNLGADPEIRRTQAGDPVASFRVATSESWRDKNSGERKERTEWHSVVVFNEGLAKLAEQYLKKGMKVYVEGAQQTRKWTGTDGIERWTTEVVLAKFRGELHMLEKSGNARPPAGSQDDYGTTRARDDGDDHKRQVGQRTDDASRQRDLDDEIPF